jgi:KDO2-lipid IV(A) lauroyltransferase
MDTENSTQPQGLLGRSLAALFEIAAFPVTRLPARALLGLGRFLGLLGFGLLRRRRVIAEDNILRCREAGALPADASPREIGREAFACVSQTILEALALHQRGLGYFQGRVDFKNAGALDASLKECGPGKRGLILLTAHMGNWELLPLAIRGRWGVKINIVGRTQGHLFLDSLIYQTRTQTGNAFIFKNAAARAMIKILRAGGIVGTLYDQAAIVERESAVLTFMGRPALTNLGPAKLAAFTGAVMLPVFGAREGARHVFEFCEPVPAPKGADSAWVLAAAQSLNDTLSEKIRARPGQWLWGHRRWKSQEGWREDHLPS